MTRSGSGSGDRLLSALRARGARIRQVRYRSNRTVLLSVSRDGRTLNSHACFREAPGEIVDAIARFITARPGSREAGRALERVRGWEGTRDGLAAARRVRPRRSRPGTDGPEAAPLRTLFDRLNRERFGGALPRIPLRVSRRMTRSLGTIRYGGGGGSPHVEEIALSADLLLPNNAGALKDTMLHEMAHAEAWLKHGHRGHGPPWRRIAERVGCTPRALCRTPIVRRKERSR
jgi:hypothetical protein